MNIISLQRAIKTSLLFLFLTPITTFAQEVYSGQKASSIYKEAQIVRENLYSELPSYISFRAGQEIDMDAIFPWMKKNLQLSNSTEFNLIRKETDELGFTHYRYQETFAGKPINGAMWLIHTKNDKVLSMNGLIYADLSNSGSVVINESQALDLAKTHVGAITYKWEIPGEEKHLKWEQEDPDATYFPTGELFYVANQHQYNSQNYRLAYRFNIYAQAPLSRAYIYVDAATGEILSENSILHDIDTPGTAVTAYSGTRTIVTDDTGTEFRLQETGRGDGIRTFNMGTGTNYGAATDFTDADNTWNNVNAEFDEYATDAHWGAEMTYDYYSSIHSRNSIDDAGFRLDSYIHYDVGYFNAFWDGSRMTYGDGSGSPLTSVDIAGHEITHGLDTYTANLNYQDESGALNESFSDVFGTSIENFARPANWNWMIGEDVGGAFRSMSDPNSENDPDTYFGNFWAPLGGGDNGGVHTNSGVQNYWYYLLTEGGTGTNDNGDAYAITGIGFSNSSAVAFRNLTVYLTQTSQYADARFYAIVSAIDIFGACSPEVEATTNAWHAVGVGDIYSPTVIADFSAPITTACSAPFTIDFVNSSNNASTFSWDFGDGTTSAANNPSHTYLTAGSYDVQLFADGGTCGNDLTTYTAFIDIDPNNPCVVTLPGNGTSNLQTACSGTIYDPGGAAGSYGPNQDAQVTISPIGAVTVDLTFTSFDVEPGTSGILCDYDFLEVYDGASSAAPLIGTYCNNNLPPVVSSTGGSITVVFHSDGGLELAGFQINWQCILSTQPPVSDFNANVITTCTGDVTFSDLSTNGPTAWSWDFGDGTNSTAQNPSHTYTSNGTFTVQLTSTNGNGSNSSTQMNYITVNAPPAPTGVDDNICENNTASLNVTGTNSITWYDSSNGGNIVGTGNTFTTPILNLTTTYYAEEEIPFSPVNVGPTDNTFGGGDYYSGDQSLTFDCSTPLKLNSVWVDANTAGNRTIELKNSLGTVLQTITVSIPAGQSRVDLNFDVPAGANLQLGTQVGSNPDLFRNNTGTAYPYSIGGLIDITSSSAGDLYYYHFYDWEIQEYSCISTRAAVTANVNPNTDATITPGGPFCTTDASITLNAANPGGTWSGAGVSGTTFDPSIAGNGNHIITYTIPGMCGNTATETFAVSDEFDATISMQTPLCSTDVPINLTATDTGGAWSGTGITNGASGTFNPSAAGAGTHTITYAFAGACGDTDTYDVIVNATPDSIFSSPSEICIFDGAIQLTPNQAGGTWSSTCGTCVNSTTGEFDPSVAGGGTWNIYYTISSGNCTASSSAPIFVDACLSITEATTNDILLFPNPANDEITIITGNLESGGVTITDMVGKQITAMSFSQGQLTITFNNSISTGNYFVNIFNSEGKLIAVKKFIKQ